jgi:hypothetical protein
LAGQEPTENDVRQIVVDCPTEHGLVEYKAGSWVAAPKAAAGLREYVAGFANVSGGIIILGYHHASGTFADTQPPGREALENWMANATRELRPHFHLPPRHWTVHMREGTIGVIAAPRSLTLIPIIEGSRRRYPVRWGATVEDLPDDLALDILLGRRRNPYLRVRLLRAACSLLQNETGAVPDVVPFQLELALTIENAGLVFAESVRAGLVGWALHQAPGLPSSLGESVDAVEPSPQHWRAPWVLTHFRNLRDQGVGAFRGGLDLAPFDVSVENMIIRVLPRFPDHSSVARDGDAEWRGEIRGRVRWRAGLYVVAKNTEPLWFQLTVDYDQADTTTPTAADIEPVDARPPVAVTFRPLP